MSETRVEIRPAEFTDAAELAPKLRAADEAEVRASSGKEPLDIIIDALKRSTERWCLHLDGELACLWGVVPYQDSALSGRAGIAWLLTTPVIEQHKDEFWKLCRQELADMLDRWDCLINAIDVRHEKAIRWADKLGFALEAPEPFGAAGLPFRRFRLTREMLDV